MTIKSNILNPKRGNIGKTSAPFVGKNEPFVGYIRPHVLPFVGKKLPFAPNRTNQSGFTLVELAVTVTIAAILTAWGMSSWKNLLLDNRIVTQANEIMAELTLARSEAIKRRKNVMVCSSNNLTACTDTNWELGWIIFEDTDKSNQINGDETLLRVHESLSGGNTLGTGTGIGWRFNYSRLGLANITTGSGRNEFLLCDSRAESFGRKIQLSGTGRPSIIRGCTATPP